MAYNPTVGKSSILFSTGGTITAGSQFDSGWLDMETVDKYQLSVYAQDSWFSGTNVQILSRQSEGQPILSSNTAPTSSFFLLNVPARQQYMRFVTQNNNAVDMTGTTFEAKATYGSSDKLTVLPLANTPSDFSQAGLMRSVGTGRQPDGDYVNQKADGSAFSTSLSLASGETYTSDWVDTDGWATTELFITTDVVSQTEGIIVEFTDDANAETPTVRFSRTFSFSQSDIDRNWFDYNFRNALNGFRVKFINGKTAQDNFYLSATLKTATDNVSFNKGGGLLTADFLVEVALGNASNYLIDTKFGRNPEIDNGTFPEDIWESGGLYTGQPQNFTPEQVRVTSTSTSDTLAGTGARKIEISGLKSTGSTVYETETINLSGTTAAVSVNTWWRVFRVRVTEVGSGGGNAGVLTIRSNTTTANVFSTMEIGFNQSQVGAITVPAGQRMLIRSLRFAITRANGAAGSATASLRTREYGSNKPYQTTRVYELQTGDASDVNEENIVLDELTDIKSRIESVSDNNTIAESSVRYVLVSKN